MFWLYTGPVIKTLSFFHSPNDTSLKFIRAKYAFYQFYHIIKTQKLEAPTQSSARPTVAYTDTYLYEDGDFLQ